MRTGSKVDRLTGFNRNGNAILSIGGVAITLLVLLLYHDLVTQIKFDNLAGIKTMIVAVLLGFGVSSAGAGIISSIYAGSVNVEPLSFGNELRFFNYRFKKIIKVIIPILSIMLVLCLVHA